ncbi:TPA: hypothetical protein H1005_00905 [archaeon]|uniref:Uncharacterized protein n=1 Tax=Candidatus Naiadarchaeum limnaeum TaxID=2756139 RepID=A0A832V4D6_9ARCH|nr:hypothetical protein [Candidatus Naiadarchaeales archaeon SRR2090153.bin1042]HIJ99909.1 hypothetical protein [Candidatus Naiadarchaeum limnaeum]
MNIDIWGYRKNKKQKKRDVLEQNKMKGRYAEDMAALNLATQGYEVERTGRGHDFKVRKRDILTGRVTETGYREIKSGRASLSKLQRKTKKKKSNYRVMRSSSLF